MILGEMSDSRTGIERVKMSLEHCVYKNVRKYLKKKKKKGMPKDTRANHPPCHKQMTDERTRLPYRGIPSNKGAASWMPKSVLLEQKKCY